jgi:BMFP domain-containing protein YqiC
MADRLPADKPPDVTATTAREVLERLLEARFDVVDREEFPSGTRTLTTPRPVASPAVRSRQGAVAQSVRASDS